MIGNSNILNSDDNYPLYNLYEKQLYQMRMKLRELEDRIASIISENKK